MEFTEITEEVRHDLEPESAAADQCDECGAPLDRLQRYCISCGARRLSVPDPAAVYLAQASARARLRARPANAAPRGARSARTTLNGTTALLALVAILVAIGVGVLIGRGTGGGGNSAQLQKLSQQVSKLEADGTASTSSTSAGAKNGSTSSTKGSASGVDNATGPAYLKKALHGSGSVSVP